MYQFFVSPAGSNSWENMIQVEETWTQGALHQMECGVGLHTRIFSSFLQRDKGPQANIAQHTSQKIHFFIVHLHLEEWPRVNVTMLSSRYFSSSKKELCWCLDRNFCAIHSIQCHFYRRSLYFFFESLYARIHLKRSPQDTKFTNQARTSYTTILTITQKATTKGKLIFPLENPCCQCSFHAHQATTLELKSSQHLLCCRPEPAI